MGQADAAAVVGKRNNIIYTQALLISSFRSTFIHTHKHIHCIFFHFGHQRSPRAYLIYARRLIIYSVVFSCDHGWRWRQWPICGRFYLYLFQLYYDYYYDYHVIFFGNYLHVLYYISHCHTDDGPYCLRVRVTTQKNVKTRYALRNEYHIILKYHMQVPTFILLI